MKNNLDHLKHFTRKTSDHLKDFNKPSETQETSDHLKQFTNLVKNITLQVSQKKVSTLAPEAQISQKKIHRILLLKNHRRAILFLLKNHIKKNLRRTAAQRLLL